MCVSLPMKCAFERSLFLKSLIGGMFTVTKRCVVLKSVLKY